MKVGFTGTQRGMSRAQQNQVYRLLEEFYLNDDDDDYTWFLHGDCVGADEQAHWQAKQIGYRIWVFPPIDGSKRAYCEVRPQDESAEPKLFLVRNNDIVRNCNVLIAAPHTTHEVRRSGTWATIRRARRHKRTHYIVFTNGSFERR